MIVGIVHHGLVPRSLVFTKNKPLIPIILLVTGISIMMFTGMAGEPSLDVYIRAGLLLWLLNYAVVHLCILILRRRLPIRSQRFQVSGYPLVTIIGLFITFIGFIGLLILDKEGIHMLTFMIVIYIITTLCSLFWIGLGGKKRDISQIV
jgi:L-asparagine transporter-like permease